MKQFTKKLLDDALSLLGHSLQSTGKPPVELVVCGGSALIAANLIHRTTKDVDILALHGASGFIDPDPLPDYLVESALFAARILNLPTDWINTGPADLFRMGLPEGLNRGCLKGHMDPALRSCLSVVETRSISSFMLQLIEAGTILMTLCSYIQLILN